MKEKSMENRKQKTFSALKHEFFKYKETNMTFRSVAYSDILKQIQ